MSKREWAREEIYDRMCHIKESELLRRIVADELDIKEMVTGYYGEDMDGLADLLEVDITDEAYESYIREGEREKEELSCNYNSVRL